MCRQFSLLSFTALLLTSLGAQAETAKPAKRYFAQPAAEDRYGVIAPWYRGPNGQCDFRVRIAAETLKRYPWAGKELAVMTAPHFVFNGHWSIHPDGTVVIDPRLSDWDNGDIGQRSASLFFGLTDYYRYTSDPAAIALVTLTADYLLDYCQTPADHPWPNFFISCPTKGKVYRRANPHGFIQLDVGAEVGSGLVAVYKLTGNPRYLAAVKHWADLLAEHCDRRPGARPWNRYANPQDARWDTRQTAGVSLVLQFLDDVIRLGHEGRDGALRKARDAGDRYLRDVLLPEWSRDPTFGHHFWDWLNPTYTCSLPVFTSQYMMNRREAFPEWKTDVRNVLSLFLARSSVDPASAGGVYSGAWAVPESSNCCGKSLQYPTMAMASALGRYGALARSEWAREVARRQALISTYDAHETGVVEDAIDGGAVVAGAWFNLAHPWPLHCVMDFLAWQPDVLGAHGENHIMRSSSVVRNVNYGKGRIAYSTFDAAPAEDVLRLAFPPTRITADGKPLPVREDLSQNGFTIKPLGNGDCLVTVRHDGCRDMAIEGDDPQEAVGPKRLGDQGQWATGDCPNFRGHAKQGDENGSVPFTCRAASQAGARAAISFEGDQVRLIAQAGPSGGKADVYLDGVKQLCGIDFWCPQRREQQVLYYRNGLAAGKHRLETVALGTKNPLSAGTEVNIEGVQWSNSIRHTPLAAGFGEGRGPTGSQRVIFGYVGRKDHVDSTGHAWRPATEFTLRIKHEADLVPLAFWTGPRLQEVAGTADAALYRYGVYGPDFTAYFTVAPQQTYHAKLKFCQADRPIKPGGLATSIDILGKTVVRDMDIAATAGGLGKAVDVVFDDLRPSHGVISIRFWNRFSGNAMVQAIEIGPGRIPAGAVPVEFRAAPW
jgi:hypothetical protein